MAEPAAARVPTESQSRPIPRAAGEKMFVGAGMVGAERQDIGGAADVEQLADARAEEHQGGAGVDHAGHHGRAGRSVRNVWRLGGDRAGDAIGFEDLRELGDGDAGGATEFFAPGAELEGFVKAGEGSVGWIDHSLAGELAMKESIQMSDADRPCG